MTFKVPDSEFRRLATQQYHREGEVEIDDEAEVSRGDDDVTGAYVQAWVWVEVDSDDEDEEPFDSEQRGAWNEADVNASIDKLADAIEDKKVSR